MPRTFPPEVPAQEWPRTNAAASRTAASPSRSCAQLSPQSRGRKAGDSPHFPRGVRLVGESLVRGEVRPARRRRHRGLQRGLQAHDPREFLGRQADVRGESASAGSAGSAPPRAPRCRYASRPRCREVGPRRRPPPRRWAGCASRRFTSDHSAAASPFANARAALRSARLKGASIPARSAIRSRTTRAAAENRRGLGLQAQCPRNRSAASPAGVPRSGVARRTARRPGRASRAAHPTHGADWPRCTMSSQRPSG